MTAFTSENLIFLVSQPRSGSTMLQHILAGQPQIHTTAEPWIMLHPIYALRSQGYEAEYDAQLAQEALQDFYGALPGGQEQYEEAIRQMALYLYGAAAQQAGKRLFLDKTPRYYLILSDLARILPQAKFILLFRNPLAVLNSLLNSSVKGRWVLLARYKNDLLLAPELLLKAADALQERAYVVHYEELVTEPQKEVTALCSWLGLTYQPQMLDYGRNPPLQGAMGDPAASQKYALPSTERLDNWLDLAKDPQTRHFAQSYLQALGPDLVGRLGYDYAGLSQQLASVPAAAGEISFTWEQLFNPDAEMKIELKYAELAILEKRRLAHRFRRMIRKK